MKTINIKLPKHWNDLTAPQLLAIANLFTKGHDKTKFKIFAYLRLTNTKTRKRPPHEVGDTLHFPFRQGGVDFDLTEFQLLDICHQLDFLLQPSQLTNNKLPKLKHRIGPGKALSNITWAEFEAAEGYFTNFSKTKNEIELNKLIATLYRKADKNNSPENPDFTGDQREAFNPHLVEKQAKHFRRLPIEYKFVVYLFYTGCRNNLIAQFNQVFGQGEATEAEPDPLRHINLINAINNDDVTKNDEIRQTALFEILIFLQKKAEDAERLKAETQHS